MQLVFWRLTVVSLPLCGPGHASSQRKLRRPSLKIFFSLFVLQEPRSHWWAIPFLNSSCNPWGLGGIRASVKRMVLRDHRRRGGILEWTSKQTPSVFLWHKQTTLTTEVIKFVRQYLGPLRISWDDILLSEGRNTQSNNYNRVLNLPVFHLPIP